MFLAYLVALLSIQSVKKKKENINAQASRETVLTGRSLAELYTTAQ